MLIGAVFVASAAALAYFVVYSRSARPTTNVLFITLDTTRADHLGCYGYEKALTPVLDRLAAEGTLFERAYSPAPLTLPAHASLFTGLYPPEHGLRTNGRGRLDPAVPTLGAILAGHGYDVGAFVGSFVLDSKFGLNRGFTVYDDDLTGAEPDNDALHRQRDGKAVVDSAMAWLQAPRSTPFFCWVHLYDPHFPYLTHDELFQDRFHGAAYDGEIAYVDRQIGRLVERLQQAHLDATTLVVVVGDHGEGLGEHVERTHGYTLYNATQHVPFLMWKPGRIAEGHRHALSVSLVDVFPTVLECVGLRPPDAISGRSLAPALRGQTVGPTVCYAATDDPYLQNGWSPLRSLTTDRWKYIRTTDPELYDLEADPRETRNLAGLAIEERSRIEDALEGMERRMATREAGAVNLSANERRALASLGYVGGIGPAAGAGDQAHGKLPDVKDMLKYDIDVQEALDLLHAGNVEQATQRLRSVVESSASHVASRIYLGDALERSGKIAEAIASYEEALKINPDCVDALVHLGTALMSQGRPDDAIALFDEALRIDPESAVTHYNLGLALASLQKPEAAIIEFEEALRVDHAAPYVRAALGNVLVRLGRLREASQQFEREIEINPRAIEARINLATLLAEEQPKEAHALLLNAVRLDPRNPQAQYSLGAFLLTHGRPEEAIDYLSAAVRLMPNHPKAAIDLQRARRLAGESAAETGTE